MILKNMLAMTMIDPVYLVLSVLDMIKVVIYEYWYNYAEPKYGGRTKLRFMDTATL